MKLHNKYTVTKTSGRPIDPQAQYFVLRIDKDIHARVALKAYADSTRSSDPNFADELEKWLDDTRSTKPESESQEDGVYSHPDCIWNYCPSPDDCKNHGGCLNQSRSKSVSDR